MENGTQVKIKDLLLFERVIQDVLHVFDIDDTLFFSTARIRVKDGSGKEIKSLSNSEFNHYKLQSGEQFDFSDFRSSDKFLEGVPHRDTIRKLNTILKNPNNKIIINTARADLDDKDKFLSKFKAYGIPIEHIHVHRAGNIAGSDLPAYKKLVYIRQYLDKSQYKEVHMYDDSKTNLAAFETLSIEYPSTKFISHLIR